MAALGVQLGVAGMGQLAGTQRCNLKLLKRVINILCGHRQMRYWRARVRSPFYFHKATMKAQAHAKSQVHSPEPFGEVVGLKAQVRSP